MRTQQTTEMDPDEKIARLKAAARERWGERWTVEARHFADGDVQVVAVSNNGLTEGGFVKQERLFLTDDGGTVAEEVILDCREVDEGARS